VEKYCPCCAENEKCDVPNQHAGSAFPETLCVELMCAVHLQFIFTILAQFITKTPNIESTKEKMYSLFFVLPTFRAFVVKPLFIFFFGASRLAPLPRP